MNRREFLRNAVKGLVGLVVAAWLPGRSKQFVDDSRDELTPVDIVSFDGDELTTGEVVIGEFASFDDDGFTINLSDPYLVSGDPMRKMAAPNKVWDWTKKGVI